MPHSEEWYRNWKPPSQIVHGQATRWGWVAAYPERLRLGRFVDIGYGTYIMAKMGVTIGDYCEVGGGCFIYSVSTIDDTAGPVVLGEGCRVGAGCIILPRVSVGAHSIIGAGTVVTRNIPADVVVRPERHLIITPLEASETGKRRSE